MTLYWRLFNFIVRRIMSVAFAVGGLIMAVASFPYILPGGTIDIDGVPSDDLVFRWTAFMLPLIIAAFGVALYRAKPFNPPWRSV
ncbi:hypothetical protein [Pseudoduganella sp.]|uniref:hypothetical protein n=1 Tax=Pseudoduganella sp. TaxID=1880898 RepID=UPI0035B2B19E